MIRACLRPLPRLLFCSLPRRHLSLDTPYSLLRLEEQSRLTQPAEREQHSSSEFESDSEDSSDFYS